MKHLNTYTGIIAVFILLTGCAKANDEIADPSGLSVFRQESSWSITAGSGTGQFMNPQSIQISPQNEVYIADYSNDRIQVFTKEGVFVRTIGSRGTAVGEFIGPRSATIDSLGNVLASDFGNNRVLFFAKDTGGFTNTLTMTTFNGMAINQPYGVATYEEFVPQITGNFYIVDSGNSRVVCCDRAGVFVWTFGTDGTSTAQLHLPTDIAVTEDGTTIYVSDTGNNRIMQLNSSGTFLAQFNDGGESHIALNGNVGITVDHAGDIYVADQHNHRIIKYSSIGAVLGYFDFAASIYPADVAVDHLGYVYVVDFINSAVYVLKEYN